MDRFVYLKQFDSVELVAEVEELTLLLRTNESKLAFRFFPRQVEDARDQRRRDLRWQYEFIRVRLAD